MSWFMWDLIAQNKDGKRGDNYEILCVKYKDDSVYICDNLQYYMTERVVVGVLI